MSTTPDLPPLMALQRQLAIYDAATVEQHPKRAFAIEGVISAAREAVRLAARASVPAGWKLVPMEETAEMCAADWRAAAPYRHALDKCTNRDDWVLFINAGLRASYRAILAAAPAAPTPPDEATSRDAALWRKWVPYLSKLQRKPFELARDADAAMKDAARTQGDAA